MNGYDQLWNVLLLAAVAAALVRIFAKDQVRALWAGSWPTTQGTVESGTISTYRTKYGKYYVAELAYSYAVSGEYYSGYYKKTFLREASAQRFVDGLKGQMVFVRHKADSAGRSVLLKQDQLGGWPK